MPSEYIPKNSHMNKKRVEKTIKELISEAGEDRTLAIEAHKYFRSLLDEDPQDISARNLLIECLKVAQTSKNNVIKLLGVVVKMQETGGTNQSKLSSKGLENDVFSQLSNTIND